jgi:flagellar hook protein FlgE
MRVDQTALSGMQAHEAMFTAGASNVANLNTPDYDAKTVQLAASAAAGGVQVTGVADRHEGEAPTGVDLAEETAGQIVAPLGYTPNATVVRAHDELSGTLIDVLA